MIPSIVLNALIAPLAVLAVLGHSRRHSLRYILRFFTALSNLLCGAAALTVAISRLMGDVPQAVLLFKYMGTVSVTVTMLTVLLFLGPTIGFRLLLTGPDFWLHLVCPVLALVSYFGWDQPEMPFAGVLLGVLPVALYGALYLYQVIFAKSWEDFYGFNRGGKWKISLAAMLAATVLVSVALWAL